MHAAAITALFVAATSLAAQQPTDDARAALATVESMFRAMKTRDTALLRSLFDPGARLTGIRTRNDGNTVLQAISVDQWVNVIARDPRPDWTERAFDPEIKIEGTLAQIWAHYDFHFGSTFSHCGVDAVHLLKQNGRWQIVSIADTYQTSGCPQRPKP
jgi:Putative lumazine-binding